MSRIQIGVIKVAVESIRSVREKLISSYVPFRRRLIVGYRLERTDLAADHPSTLGWSVCDVAVIADSLGDFKLNRQIAPVLREIRQHAGKRRGGNPERRDVLRPRAASAKHQNRSERQGALPNHYTSSLQTESTLSHTPLRAMQREPSLTLGLTRPPPVASLAPLLSSQRQGPSRCSLILPRR